MVTELFLMIVVALSVSHGQGVGQGGGQGLPTFDNLPVLQEQCAGNMCVVAGDPHFTTFDCVKYEYHGQCDYTLVKTCGSDGNDVENESFEVIGQFERLRYNPKVSVVKSISLHIANSVVRLDDKFSVFIDGEQVSDETTFRPWGVIIKYDNAVVIELFNGLTIYWCSPYQATFSIEPDSALQQRGDLCGLCGSNNANKSDEFESGRNEQLGQGVVSFGDGWRTNPEECGPCDDCTDTVCQINKDNHEHAQELCQVFTNGALPDCRNDLDHQATYDRCMADMCAFLPELTKLCSLVYDYAATCLVSSAGFVDVDALGVCGFCQDDQFRCKDGTCIPGDFYCDYIPDCPDSSDESDCDSYNVDNSWSSSSWSSLSSGSCDEDDFICPDGYCIPQYFVCDDFFDCDDDSDESNCDNNPSGTTIPPYSSSYSWDHSFYSDSSSSSSGGSCDEDDFICPDGYCIPQYYVCDEFFDCFDDSDESNCDNNPSGTTIPPYSSSYPWDHSFYSDSSSSSSGDPRPCNDDEFQCDILASDSPRRCIADWEQCDGYVDCGDGIDEDGCDGSSSSWSSPSSISSYPSSSSISSYPYVSSYPYSSSHPYSSSYHPYSSLFYRKRRSLQPNMPSSSPHCSAIWRKDCQRILPYSKTANMLFPDLDKHGVDQIYKSLISGLNTTTASHHLFACALAYPQCPSRRPKGQYKVPCRQLCKIMQRVVKESAWPIDCDTLPVDNGDHGDDNHSDGLCTAHVRKPKQNALAANVIERGNK